MPMHRFLKVIVLSTPALVAPAFMGCQSDATRERWVEEGNQRWRNMRSALLLEKAENEFVTGDLHLAEKTVREALNVDPKNARFLVLAGQIALERGQLEHSYHLFNKAIELNDRLAQAHFFQGIVLERWQQFNPAYERYARAYEIEPDDVAHLLAMGEMLVTLDRSDDALELLEGKLIYFDQNSALMATIGHLYVMKQQPKEAARFFRQAALLQPDNLKIQEELALAQFSAGWFDVAIQTLHGLLSRPDLKDRRDLRRALAEAYHNTGRGDDALQEYRGLARSGDIASDWIKLGELALHQGDLFSAAQAASQAIRLAPQAHEGYLLAGLIQHRRQKLDDALRMFDCAAERNTQSAEPLILRGIALEKAGQLTAAAQAYRDALVRQPDDARAKRLLRTVDSALN